VFLPAMSSSFLIALIRGQISGLINFSTLKTLGAAQF
jgi:hypothetical protein